MRVVLRPGCSEGLRLEVYYDRMRDLVVPRLASRVPQRREGVEEVGDGEEPTEDDGDEVAAHGTPKPDGRSRPRIADRDAQCHLPEGLAAARPVHGPVVDGARDRGE